MLNQNEGIELNSKGYLVNFDTWNKEFAIKVAKENDVELTECHWHIINFLREYYVEFGTAPHPRQIIKTLGPQIRPDTPCTRNHLEGLFARGGCKLACKIAGLPDSFCSGC